MPACSGTTCRDGFLNSAFSNIPLSEAVQAGKEQLLIPWTKPYLIELAYMAASSRFQGHEGRRKPWQDRGSVDINFAADLRGAIAEAAAVLLLNEHGIPCLYSLFDTMPGNEDLRFPKGGTIDVKSFTGRYATINLEAHRKTRARHYWLMGLSQQGVLIYMPIPIARIAQWTIRDDAHSPYLSQDIRRLKPMRREDMQRFRNL